MRYTVVDDFGATLNPLLLAGQVHGGIAQGVGQALMERAVYDESGQLLTASSWTTACRAPTTYRHFDFETRNIPSTTNPLGFKGAGEAGSIGSTPAVMNAVGDALWRAYGVDHIDMPATPLAVYRAIKNSRRRGVTRARCEISLFGRAHRRRARPTTSAQSLSGRAHRLFHWLVVALVAAAYATQALNWMDWHALAGDAVLVLVAFRLVWGFVGGETARFAGFLASPREALGHLKTMLKREPDLQVGHNPAGGWMVLMLLALLLGETLTGLYALDDVAEVGPLTPYVPAPVANWIDAAHATLWDILLARGGAPCVGGRDIRPRERPKSADADDHRPQADAGGNAAAAHGVVGACGARVLRRRPYRRRAHYHDLKSGQPFGGITWPRISPAGFAAV